MEQGGRVRGKLSRHPGTFFKQLQIDMPLYGFSQFSGKFC